MFFEKQKQEAMPAETLEQRLAEAEARISAHVKRIEQRRAEFATAPELAMLERTHWENLRQWSGLKQQLEQEQKACHQ